LEVGGFPEHIQAMVPVREARQRIREDIAERAILRDLRQTGVDIERIRRLFVYLINGSGNAWNQARRADESRSESEISGRLAFRCWKGPV